MRKIFYLIFTSAFLLVVSFGIMAKVVLAEGQYSEDYFILKSEKFPSSENAGADLLANGFDLEVDGARVSSQLVGDFNLGGLSNCGGTSSFKLRGDRDTKNGTMKGTFLYLMSGECPGGDGVPASPISLTWEGTFDGFATFDLDPSDETRRIIEGKITNLQGESVFVLNNVAAAPTKTESITINFPKVVLEGYEKDVTSQDSGMRFSGMTGQVRIRPDVDKRGWHSLEPGEAIPFGTHISTGPNSSVAIILPDGVTFFLKSDTEIVINKPSEKKGYSQILYGSVKVVVEERIQDESLEIDMDQAIVEISGTTLILEEKEEKSTLQVIEGEVSFTSKTSGETVKVTTGNTVSASSTGLSGVETFDVAKATAEWEAVSSGVEGVTSEAESEKSKVFLFLYGLIGVVVIGVLIIVVRKIKNRKRR